MRHTREGDSHGFCAEAKRLWEEARNPEQWDEDADQSTETAARRAIEEAASYIAKKRLRKWIERRDRKDPDTEYGDMWDQQTWRCTNGTVNQVGLMITARGTPTCGQQNER